MTEGRSVTHEPRTGDDVGTAQGGEADPRIGMAIGKYVITRKLAEGGMGMVYVATHPPSGMTQVVKFVLPQFARDPALRIRFERECKTAVRMRGKINIVRIESYNIDPEGDTYIVMEHLQGETLEEHLRRCGRVSKHHAFRLIAQMINALHGLHKEGIIHRDLKPANIFIVEDEHEAYRVKLIDFGIVHDRNAAPDGLKTRTGSLVGTPGYMAIEQFGDAGNVTPAADVFALAVIIWEMFTGQLPWGYGPNEFALYERQKSEPPTLPPGHTLPPEWEQIVRLALDPNPARRPPLHALLYALARGTPAEPPMFPAGGFDMVVDYAPNVLRNTPVEVETVRATDAQRAAASNWAMQRATIAPSGSSNARLALRSNDMPISAPGWTPAPAPASMPTVNARPVNAAPDPASPQTTLSASAGESAPVAAVASTPAGESALVSAVSTVERKRGWRVLALAGAATTVLAFVVVAFVSSTISRRSSSAKPATLPADEPTKIETTTNTGAATLSGGSVPDPAPTAPAATVPSPAGTNASVPPSTTAPPTSTVTPTPAETGARKDSATPTSTVTTTAAAETDAHKDSATPSRKQRPKTRATKSATSTTEPTTGNRESRSRATSSTTSPAAHGPGPGSGTLDPDAIKE